VQPDDLRRAVRRVGAAARHREHELAAALHRADRGADEVDQDQRADARQRHVPDLPEEARALELGRLVEVVRNGLERRKVHEAPRPHAGPDRRKQAEQQRRPRLREPRLREVGVRRPEDGVHGVDAAVDHLVERTVGAVEPLPEEDHDDARENGRQVVDRAVEDLAARRLGEQQR
jgi:hypothetical protein